MSLVAPSPSVATVLDRLRDHYGRPRLPRNPRGPLDGLVETILSQHTSDSNTARAAANLRARFPTWEAVMAASVDQIADAIRTGGLAHVKAPRIKAVLEAISERRGELSLEFLHETDIDEGRRFLTSLDGVGPKTAACVLLFQCRKPALPE